MPNVATLEIQKELMATTPITTIGTATVTATTNMITTTKTTKIVKTTHDQPFQVR
jgi:hypothetical protein